MQFTKQEQLQHAKSHQKVNRNTHTHTGIKIIALLFPSAVGGKLILVHSHRKYFFFFLNVRKFV